MVPVAWRLHFIEVRYSSFLTSNWFQLETVWQSVILFHVSTLPAFFCTVVMGVAFYSNFCNVSFLLSLQKYRMLCLIDQGKSCQVVHFSYFYSYSCKQRSIFMQMAFAGCKGEIFDAEQSKVHDFHICLCDYIVCCVALQEGIYSVNIWFENTILDDPMAVIGIGIETYN